MLIFLFSWEWLKKQLEFGFIQLTAILFANVMNDEYLRQRV